MRLTLRAVIGAMCALIVLAVSITTLAITYSLSLSTIRDIGSKHALVLANNAALRTQFFFEEPARFMRMAARAYEFPGMQMPGERPNAVADPWAAYRDEFWLLYGINNPTNWQFLSAGFIYEDGGGIQGSFAANNPAIAVYWYSNAAIWNNGNGTMLGGFRGFWQHNHTEVLAYRAIPATQVDSRFALYNTVKPFFPNTAAGRRGLWNFPTLYNASGATKFNLAAVAPLYNATGLIGLGSVAVGIDEINVFLRAVKNTPGMQAFAVDGSGFLMGSTHSTPFLTMTNYTTTARPAAAGVRGCSWNGDASNSFAYSVVGCRIRASQFSAFEPLVELAGQGDFITSATSRVMQLRVSGELYFAVTVPISNSMRSFAMNIVLILPENDIIGDIVAGRNIAIGVTAGVFLVAVAISFLMVYLMMKPLTDLSRRMANTAKLRETKEETSFSTLAEIRDLQKAYTNMNVAIGSFTRYVPRDVVKDLMMSNQLCEIKMTPLRCTMLFADIAGFTTICERVPPDVLSDLVTEYFERASRIVMHHEGLIDKFIGDCIMAVWGAPFEVTHQELKAVLAGLLLNRETHVEPLAASWDSAGELLRVRVGLATGVILAGNMGSQERMNYTVIGDDVNLAARLESMNKQFDMRVMIAEETAAALRSVFVLRLVMSIAVVGKSDPVKVYDVLGINSQIDPADQQFFSNDSDVTKGGDDTESDSQSQSESMSAVSNQRNKKYKRKSKHTALQFVRDALSSTAVSTYPLTCTEHELMWAQQYTTAVTAYAKADFAGALRTVEQLRLRLPKSFLAEDLAGERFTPAARRSLSLLEDLATQYLTSGAPPDFNGVYVASEK